MQNTYSSLWHIPYAKLVIEETYENHESSSRGKRETHFSTRMFSRKFEKLFQEVSRRDRSFVIQRCIHRACIYVCVGRLAFANFSTVALVHSKCLFPSTLVRDTQTSFQKQTRKKRSQPAGYFLPSPRNILPHFFQFSPRMTLRSPSVKKQAWPSKNYLSSK